jgi:hypothetical protein
MLAYFEGIFGEKTKKYSSSNLEPDHQELDTFEVMDIVVIEE